MATGLVGASNKYENALNPTEMISNNTLLTGGVPFSNPVANTTQKTTIPTTTKSANSQNAYVSDVKDWVIDPETQTVQGQIAGITAEDSPLMKLAQTSALQNMNRRGLVNSDLAISAGQAATYEAALPIATQDAATYANAAKTNVGEYNQTGRANAGNETQAAVSAANNAAQIGSARISASASMANAAANERIAKMRIEADSKAAALAHEYQMELTNSSMAGSLYNNAMNNINTIYTDPNMSNEAKQTAIDNIMGTAAEGLSLFQSMGDINLDAFLDFNT